jgi:hypothetical protein
MTKVRSVLMDLARGWSEPRVEVHSGLEVSIACALRDPAKEPDFDALRASVTGVPSELCDFWSYCNGADLFKDVTFGQWGLNLFSITESVAASDKFARERAIDAKPDDFVVGAFFGDSDLLLVRCAPDPPASETQMISELSWLRCRSMAVAIGTSPQGTLRPSLSGTSKRREKSSGLAVE